jgi:hypothetical protein
MAITITPSAGSGLVAGASFALSIATLGYTVWWQRRQAKQASLESYWFKEVIGPSCTEPLISFWKKWSMRLASPLGPPDKEAAKTIIDEFCADKSDLLRALWISELLFENFYSETADKLDDVEDLLSDVLGNIFVANARGNIAEKEKQQIATTRAGLDKKMLAILRDLANRHCGKLSVSK